MRSLFLAYWGAVFGLCFALVNPRDARAQNDEGNGSADLGNDDEASAAAEDLLNSGLLDFEEKRYSTACPKLRKSYKAKPTPGTLFHLAQCEEAAGKLASAALYYDDYLSKYQGLSPALKEEQKSKAATAAAQRKAITPRIPKVMFRLKSSAPAGTRVLRPLRDGAEGAELVEVSVGVELPIDPGDHVVFTEAPGRPRADKRFRIALGEPAKAVDLDVAEASTADNRMSYGQPVTPVVAQLPPLDPPMSKRRVAAYVVGGIGVASVIAGFVTGALVWGQKGTIEGNCRNNVCNPTGESAADLASASGLASTITFSVGGAALATSAILFLTEPEASKFGTMAPSGSIGVGPNSASFEAKWVW